MHADRNDHRKRQPDGHGDQDRNRNVVGNTDGDAQPDGVVDADIERDEVGDQDEDLHADVQQEQDALRYADAHGHTDGDEL